MESTETLRGLLDQVEDLAGEDAVDLHVIIESFGNRSFGPVLTFCGLVLLTPLGIIPGVPIAMATIIISFSVQLLAGRSHPWMPKFLRKVTITAGQIDTAQRRAGPVLGYVDRLVKPRLSWATTPPFYVVAALFSILFALTMFPLGVVPFGVVIPGLVVCVLGLGLTARDGVVLSIGFTLAVLACVLILQLIF